MRGTEASWTKMRWTELRWTKVRWTKVRGPRWDLRWDESRWDELRIFTHYRGAGVVVSGPHDPVSLSQMVRITPPKSWSSFILMASGDMNMIPKRERKVVSWNTLHPLDVTVINFIILRVKGSYFHLYSPCEVKTNNPSIISPLIFYSPNCILELSEQHSKLVTDVVQTACLGDLSQNCTHTPTSNLSSQFLYGISIYQKSLQSRSSFLNNFSYTSSPTTVIE